jgi:hypothetical protein
MGSERMDAVTEDSLCKKLNCRVAGGKTHIREDDFKKN